MFGLINNNNERRKKMKINKQLEKYKIVKFRKVEHEKLWREI